MNTNPSRQPTSLQGILPSASAPPKSQIGLELEMFGFDARTFAPIGTSQARVSPQELMRRIEKLVPNSHIKHDALTGEIIGCDLGCGNFSLEPGGQLEYASCPQDNLHTLLEDMASGLRLLEEAGQGEVVFLDHGTNPVAGPDLPLVVPKHRYKILTRYFSSQPSGRGVHMMRYSATAQPNVDVAGGQAWVDAVNLTYALTPFARALFANSRYFHSHLTGPGSERQRIWAAIDPSRTGIPPDVAFGSDIATAYADWARKAGVFLAGDLPIEEQPLYGELSFAQWEEQGYKGTHPTEADWQNHLGTLFPDLRLRRFLEVRMVDAQRYEHAMAPMAFWAIALQQEECRERLWQTLGQLATAAGAKSAAELLSLPSQDAIFSAPKSLKAILDTVRGCAQDEIARRSLEVFADWVERREDFIYPQAGIDYVREHATTHPSRQLQSRLGV